MNGISGLQQNCQVLYQVIRLLFCLFDLLVLHEGKRNGDILKFVMCAIAILCVIARVCVSVKCPYIYIYAGQKQFGNCYGYHFTLFFFFFFSCSCTVKGVRFIRKEAELKNDARSVFSICPKCPKWLFCGFYAQWCDVI